MFKMTFGIWFEWGRDRPEIKNKLTLLVDEAIDYLAPYFGIRLDDDEKWDKIDLPIVAIGRDPAYCDNVIYLPQDIKRGDPSIGHETAHWFLGILNPNFKKLTRTHPFVNKYLEPIANMYGLIYSDKIEK